MQSQFEKTDALTILAENVSLNSYKRTRLSQSFETPEAKHARYENAPLKDRKHSPNFEKVTWDKERVLEDLTSWDKCARINWSEFARNHNVPGRNGGQAVKEFAKLNNIDVSQLDNRQSRTKLRAKKLKLLIFLFLLTEQ